MKLFSNNHIYGFLFAIEKTWEEWITLYLPEPERSVHFDSIKMGIFLSLSLPGKLCLLLFSPSSYPLQLYSQDESFKINCILITKYMLILSPDFSKGI